MTDRGRELQAPEPLKGLHLAAGAWRGLQANGRALLPIGLIYAAFSVAAEEAARRLGVGAPAFSAQFALYGLVSGAVGALLSAFTLRTLLAAPGGRYRITGGLAAYVAVITVVGLGMNLLMALYAAGMPSEVDPTADPGPILGRALLTTFAMVMGLWAWIRLTLWPIGLLLGDRAMTPARSFGLMRRGVLAVIFGSLILGIGPLLVYAVLAMQSRDAGPVALAIAAPFLAFFALATTAVQGEAYRQRTRDGR